MTTPATSEGSQHSGAHSSGGVKYQVDEGWYQSHGRSLQHMIESRMEAQGISTQKGSRKKKGQDGSSSLLSSVAKAEGFISSDLPVLEAVFRLLLVHENKPLAIEQIAEELAEHGLGVRDSRVITPEGLARVLDRDTYYGITRVGGATVTTER